MGKGRKMAGSGSRFGDLKGDGRLQEPFRPFVNGSWIELIIHCDAPQMDAFTVNPVNCTGHSVGRAVIGQGIDSGKIIEVRANKPQVLSNGGLEEEASGSERSQAED